MFDISAEDELFRTRVRDWLKDNLDPDWRTSARPGTDAWVEFQKEWDRKLYRAGWSGTFWPAEHGGTGSTATQRFLYALEMAEAGAPEGLAKVGRRLLAPILMRHGSSEQKDRHLGPILKAEEFWCQGFSEPAAGSDLSALSTKATPYRDGFRLAGQKIWTSHASHCDWCFVLARTGPAATPHDGISLLLVRMDSPGLSFKPIRQINGASEFAEVFFDDVFVPQGNLVGGMGSGWKVAMSLLGFERGVEQALGKSASVRRAFNRTLAALQAPGDESIPLPSYELGRMQADIFSVYVNAVRLLSTQLEGGDPSDLSSVLKLQSSEAWRGSAFERLLLMPAETFMDEDAGNDAVLDYLTSRSATIASGTSDIQRNVIAKRLLHMGSGSGKEPRR